MRFIICPFPKLEYEAPPNGSLKSVKAPAKRRALAGGMRPAGISLRSNTALETSAAIITRQRTSEAVTVKKVRTSVIRF